MTQYGDDLEWCMSTVLPYLVPKLGSSKITVRRVTVQALITYLRQVEAFHSFQKFLVKEGLQNRDILVANEVLKEIPSLFVPDFAQRNWAPLVYGLTSMIMTNDAEKNDQVLQVMEKLLELVGQQEFNTLIRTIPEKQRSRYEVLLMEKGARQGSRFNRQAPPPGGGAGIQQRSSSVDNSGGTKQYRYGIIPLAIMDMLLNESQTKIRLHGLEQLKMILENMSDADIKRLEQHLFSYINMINNILDDLNFKIVVLSLDVLRISVNKLKRYIEPHLQQVVATMGKHLGNQKSVVKQLNMMTISDLMHTCQPKPVIAALCSYLQHRNSRVREEVLNMITAALLKFPSTSFNLTAICHVLSPLLADPKRRVRLAAFEMLSALAQAMGPGKLEPLFKCVRQVEHNDNAPGLMIAVQARLARHQLPKIRYDGLIEYSLPASPTESLKNVNTEANLVDFEWIMSAGSGPGSAVSRTMAPPSHARPLIPLDPLDTRRALSAGRTSTKPPLQSPGLISLSAGETQSAPTTADPRRHAKFPADNDKAPDDGPSTALSRSQSHPPAINNNKVLEPIKQRSDSPPIPALRNNQGHQGSPPVEEVDVLGASLDRVKFNAVKKRQEQLKQSSSAGITRVQSDGGIPNNPSPTSWDDMPIKPAKNIPPNGYREFSAETQETLLPPSPRRHSKPPPAKKKAVMPPKKPPPPPQPPAKTLPRRSHSEGSKAMPHNGNQHNHHNGVAGVSLPAAMKNIKSEEWTDKVEGITAIQNLTLTNPKAISDDLSSVVAALTAEAKNLRSGVSNKALECFGVLFMCLKKQMDPHIEKVTPVLMNKTGDVSSAFIRDNALKALEMMVDHATSSKTCPSLIASGANKSEVIRAACAQLLCRMVENLGPEKTLNGSSKDIGDKLFPQCVIFTTDKQPQPRYYGKMALQVLATDKAAFDKAVARYCTDSQAKTVRDMMQSVKSRGLGDAPQGSLHPPVTPSTSNGAGPPHGNGKANGTLTRKGSQRKPGKLSDHVQDQLNSIQKNLSSNEWQARLNGVEEFESLAKTSPNAIGQNPKIFETFIGRLNDINSKVSYQALMAFQGSMPKLAPSFNETAVRALIGEILKTLMAQLPSKNEEIRHLAAKGLDSCVKHIDNTALVGPFSMATRRGNQKQKPEMLNRLGKISSGLYSSKPKLVEMHAVPVLWDLLKEKHGESAMKKATQDFARALAKAIGKKNLLDMASTSQKPHLEQLL